MEDWLKWTASGSLSPYWKKRQSTLSYSVALRKSHRWCQQRCQKKIKETSSSLSPLFWKTSAVLWSETSDLQNVETTWISEIPMPNDYYLCSLSYHTFAHPIQWQTLKLYNAAPSSTKLLAEKLLINPSCRSCYSNVTAPGNDPKRSTSTPIWRLQKWT